MDIATTNRADKYTYNPTDRQLARLAVLSGAHMADALEWMEDSGVSFEGPQAPNLRYLPHEVQRRGEVIPVLGATHLPLVMLGLYAPWMTSPHDQTQDSTRLPNPRVSATQYFDLFTCARLYI
jgi:hypothetical protein